MAYEKQTWQNGDIITADKLNHIEEGLVNSGGGTAPLIIEANYDSESKRYTLSATWQEISNAFKAGSCQLHSELPVLDGTGTAELDEVISKVSRAPGAGGGYSYGVETSGNTFLCTSPNDYPYFELEV